jgi:hypothetical protein
MADDYSIMDGGDVPDCTKLDSIQWTYNNGQFLVGSAYLYNYVYSLGTPLIADEWRCVLER